MSSINTSINIETICNRSSSHNTMSASNLSPSQRKSLEEATEYFILKRYKEEVIILNKCNLLNLRNCSLTCTPFIPIEIDSFENYRKYAVSKIEKQQGPFISGDYELNPDYTLKNVTPKINNLNPNRNNNKRDGYISTSITESASSFNDDTYSISSHIRTYSSNSTNSTDPYVSKRNSDEYSTNACNQMTEDNDTAVAHCHDDLESSCESDIDAEIESNYEVEYDYKVNEKEPKLEDNTRYSYPTSEFYNMDNEGKHCKWDHIFDSTNSSIIITNLDDNSTIKGSSDDKDEEPVLQLKKSKSSKKSKFLRFRRYGDHKKL